MASNSTGPSNGASGPSETADGAAFGGKTPKQLEKDRKKAEKLLKHAEKKAKEVAAAVTTAASKLKVPKEPEEKLPEFVEKTPKGKKKILLPMEGHPLTKAYLPYVVESAWYDWWEEEGFFKPEFTKDGEIKPAGKFVITLPPPNVTGVLHCGHALGNSLQDLLIRWHRMRGFTTAWIPGCDHAGISTQSVVERMLWKTKQQTRHDLGREEFTKIVWKWKEDNHKHINRVQRRLGGSMDWSREAFTMNETFSAAVTENFCRLHDEGLIYRSDRLVNWCTALNTSLSNVEVEHVNLTGRSLRDVPNYPRKVEFGVMYHFNYPITGSEENIEVATTRPETIFGDTAIAVHPEDDRYKHLIGRTATHPFIQGRLLPIIADAEFIDRELGTGAVKITPAHDHNDYQIGKKHKLPFINIFTDDGHLNDEAGEKFKGLKRYDARYAVIKELEKLNLFVAKNNHDMQLSLCSKSKDVIEPRIKPQWWMKMKDLAEPALNAVLDGSIKITPQSAESKYLRWMEKIQDWCLSRQLWWGHRIPAYFIILNGERGNESDGKLWITGRDEKQAMKKAQAKFPDQTITLERDPDCLDTWFSAGLWPFCTLGWPNKTHDFEKLFPTSLLETGWDIIPFWVARMIFFSLKLNGTVPFTEVYCHSLIRDSNGEKMSKSSGNVIDPVDVMDGIELEKLHEKSKSGNLDQKDIDKAMEYQKKAFQKGIPQCGADALRFALIQYTTGGENISFNINVMLGYRKFCNKIYQATRYVLGKLPADFVPYSTAEKRGMETLAEQWILHRFNAAAAGIHAALSAREFSRSTTIAHQYFLTELCDVFIENSKAIIDQGSPEERHSTFNTLYTALEGGLRLMHPMLPYLTEELWQRLKRRPGDTTRSIMIASYPEFDPALDAPESAKSYELLTDCAEGVRSLIGDYSLKEKGKLHIQCLDDKAYQAMFSGLATVNSLARQGVASIKVLEPGIAPPVGCAVHVVSPAVFVMLEIKGQVNLDTEIAKAKKNLDLAQKKVEKSKKIITDWTENDAGAAAATDTAEESEKKINVASEAVKSAERKVLLENEAKVRNYEMSIEQFEKLKLEEGGSRD